MTCEDAATGIPATPAALRSYALRYSYRSPVNEDRTQCQVLREPIYGTT